MAAWIGDTESQNHHRFKCLGALDPIIVDKAFILATTTKSMQLASICLTSCPTSSECNIALFHAAVKTAQKPILRMMSNG
jgi:hypothetical protein